MKKILLLCLLGLFINCKTYESIDCHPDSRYYYKRVTDILKENDIKFKFRKIKQIRVSELTRGQGYYDQKQRVVYLNRVVRDPNWWTIYVDAITLTLAHEMAHSQGIMHNSDRTSLMMDSVYLYIPTILKTESVDSIIVKAFRKRN